tara:strand:- start:5178 stop:5468 length:291 start_codon:yes stop_codon:yes gene_type:complete
MLSNNSQQCGFCGQKDSLLPQEFFRPRLKSDGLFQTTCRLENKSRELAKLLWAKAAKSNIRPNSILVAQYGIALSAVVVELRSLKPNLTADVVSQL